MARTKVEIPFSKDFNKVENNITRMLISNGFKQINKNNEVIWRKGLGILTAMKFIKVDYDSDKVIISGWISVGIWPLAFGEYSLEGFTAAVPKKQLASFIKKLEAEI